MAHSELLERAKTYSATRQLPRETQSLLGAGQDGTVWRTSADTAVKVFHREGAFASELAAYQRLAELDMVKVNEFVIPRLIGFDDALQVIEKDIVSPPLPPRLWQVPPRPPAGLFAGGLAGLTAA